MLSTALNETGVENVASADVVNHLDGGRRNAPRLIAAPTYCGAEAAFHHHNLGQARSEYVLSE